MQCAKRNGINSSDPTAGLRPEKIRNKFVFAAVEGVGNRENGF